MKICHFIASSQFGGAEKVVMNLCNEMSKEHDVHLIVFGNGENFQSLSSKVTLHTVKEFKRYNPMAIFQLLRLFKKIAPDIIHTHGAKASRIVRTIGRWIPAPLIATKHNARKGKVFNRLKHVIAVSKQVALSIRGKGRYYTIYNGIEPVEIESGSMESPKVFSMCAIGRLDPIKGFDRLIDAVAQLDFDYILDIVGEGKAYTDLDKQIRRLGLEDRVKLCGYSDAIPQIMSEVDVVVMSSVSEGFSLVMVEALFYANIFVSTPVSGAIEVLDDQFLMSADAIAEKLNDIYRHKERYENDFRQLKERTNNRFLLQNVVKEHIDIYKKVCKGW